MASKKTIIEGITEDGERFRPSNWAEMVTSTVQNGRVNYSPLLRPTLSKNGYKCVMIDHSLQQSNPSLYNHILQFAAINRLRICSDDEADAYDDL